jgi:hypothetical protein
MRMYSSGQYDITYRGMPVCVCTALDCTSRTEVCPYSYVQLWTVHRVPRYARMRMCSSGLCITYRGMSVCVCTAVECKTSRTEVCPYAYVQLWTVHHVQRYVRMPMYSSGLYITYTGMPVCVCTALDCTSRTEVCPYAYVQLWTVRHHVQRYARMRMYSSGLYITYRGMTVCVCAALDSTSRTEVCPYAYVQLRTLRHHVQRYARMRMCSWTVHDVQRYARMRMYSSGLYIPYRGMPVCVCAAGQYITYRGMPVCACTARDCASRTEVCPYAYVQLWTVHHVQRHARMPMYSSGLYITYRSMPVCVCTALDCTSTPDV